MFGLCPNTLGTAVTIDTSKNPMRTLREKSVEVIEHVLLKIDGWSGVESCRADAHIPPLRLCVN
jgi:hypothetical protein